jgi:signal transduction histidine kinase
VAEGLLETRLPEEHRDEIGALAHSFNEMASALESRIAHERRFVGDVSHELRTPLTTLRTSTDYLLERMEDLPSGLQRAAELLSADLEYLQRLVDDLLDISRVEAGRVQMAMERLNVADLVREVVSRRTRVGGQEIELTVEGDPEALTTMADKQRLERVVVNLLENALTHGEGEGVSVTVDAGNGDIRLAVEDHGPGIPVRDQRRIFERFFKSDPARPRTDGRGSGLGLAIARDNANLHGGDIEVRSRPGEGTRFVFRLPRRPEEPVE